MNTRGSGILLHVTSLPSNFGIGDMGPGAYRFADFLASTRQRYWQVLPLNPTDQGSGNSPYSSLSAFAGNTLLISPDLLAESGFLTRDELTQGPVFQEERCDYASVIPWKSRLLHRAFERFKTYGIERNSYEEFCVKHGEWLEDFACYVVLKKSFHGMPWGDWPKGLRDRDPVELGKIRGDFHDEVECEKFLQYLFFKQWHSLKDHCNEHGIRLIGDIPIYLNYDSSDVWTHPGIFQLNGEKKPTAVAGVPPDYFSKTGQLWGNPLYRWDILKRTGFQWWMRRMEQNLALFDILRVDHFRGFVGFWEVPSTEKNAVNGRWVEAPAGAFFKRLLNCFPDISLIAEDLGVITDDVRAVMRRFGFPGMRVLLFGFDAEPASHPYLPHSYVPNCVAYTGTHDNNTIRGWFEHDATPMDKQRLFRYLGREVSGKDLNKELIRLAMMSVANTVIIPMQDLLGLGQEARMNYPSTTHHNWEWRLCMSHVTPSLAEFLMDLTDTYGRASLGT